MEPLQILLLAITTTLIGIILGLGIKTKAITTTLKKWFLKEEPLPDDPETLYQKLENAIEEIHELKKQLHNAQKEKEQIESQLPKN